MNRVSPQIARTHPQEGLGCFTADQMSTVRLAYLVAEDRTGDHFAMSALDSAKHSIDLRTLQDLNADERVAHDALAHLVRYQPADAHELRYRDHTIFCICLQDHNILQLLARERGRLDFFAMLVFVLTHELIHVVRFLQHHQRFDATERERWQEENLVNDMTCRLLGRMANRRVQTVLDLFRPAAANRRDGINQRLFQLQITE